MQRSFQIRAHGQIWNVSSQTLAQSRYDGFFVGDMNKPVLRAITNTLKLAPLDTVSCRAYTSRTMNDIMQMT